MIANRRPGSHAPLMPLRICFVTPFFVTSNVICAKRFCVCSSMCRVLNVVFWTVGCTPVPTIRNAHTACLHKVRGCTVSVAA